MQYEELDMDICYNRNKLTSSELYISMYHHLKGGAADLIVTHLYLYTHIHMNLCDLNDILSIYFGLVVSYRKS